MKVLFARQITQRLHIGLEWKLADCWLGVFWDRKGNTLHVWICLLPCLPIHIEVKR